MTNLTKAILLFLLIGSVSLSGQENPCACCSYNTFFFVDDFTQTFSPELIRKNGVKTVNVFTRGQQSKLDSLNAEAPAGVLSYLEFIFKFDRQGRVISKTWYPEGEGHSVNEYEWDDSGNMIRKTFTYLDSTGKKVTGFSPEITDFTYDQKGRLIKIKKRDYQGNVAPDNISKYTTFEYDSKDRVTSIYDYSYYDENSIYEIIRTTQYIDTSLISVSVVFSNGKLFSTDTIIYSANWKPQQSKVYHPEYSQADVEERYQYDGNGNLEMFHTKVSENVGSECPDGGTFTETYSYSASGLPDKIIHSYKLQICTMSISYSKSR